MLKLTLNKNPLEEVIGKTLQILKDGRIVAYPTESFYALGVSAINEKAIKRLYELKKRPPKNPMPLIVGNTEVLHSIVKPIPLEAKDLMKRFWPGALTIVFDAADAIPEILTAGTGKVAVRIPGESFALHLAKAAKFPITATSANISGMPPADTAEDVINYFGDAIDLIIDAGKTPGGKPSTIIDATVSPVRVLRAGRVLLKD
ncbi:MAG: threonylcarbamoyl-AMP synthase [Nitrospirae bacterium]|nr:threonylcarbamoyl-AMP synthase [Nitrospirota bacterium]